MEMDLKPGDLAPRFGVKHCYSLPLNHNSICWFSIYHKTIYRSFPSPSILKGLAYTQALKTLKTALLDLVENKFSQLVLMFVFPYGSPSAVESSIRYVLLRNKYWGPKPGVYTSMGTQPQVMDLFLHLSSGCGQPSFLGVSARHLPA